MLYFVYQKLGVPMENKLTLSESCKKRFYPVVEEINKLLQGTDDIIFVCIDGCAASGKTTLGYYLKSLFDCNLFHMDDFFLRDEQKTEERLKEVGGNVDYERFKAEVLKPILRKETVVYRPFSCKTRTLQEAQDIPFRRLSIVEGSYSQHPYFGDVWKLRVFMDISPELQVERIRTRNGEAMLKTFLSTWIPMENEYFEAFEIKRKSILI